MPVKKSPSSLFSFIAGLALEIINIAVVVGVLPYSLYLPFPLFYLQYFLMPLVVGLYYRKRLTGWYAVGVLLALGGLFYFVMLLMAGIGGP